MFGLNCETSELAQGQKRENRDINWLAGIIWLLALRALVSDKLCLSRSHFPGDLFTVLHLGRVLTFTPPC